MRTRSTTKLRDYKIFSVTRDRAIDDEGFEIRRAIVRHPGSAVMMAVDEHERILLVQQFRVPAHTRMWELPAGRLDPGESPLDAAVRELREETGYSAEKWTELVSWYSSPGFLEEKMTAFAAQRLTAGEQNLMDDERIRTKWFTRAELHRMIRRNEIIDGKTIVAFLYWENYRRRK
ncbi:MAG TPA: NUDIX hydrolase [Bryobacteraceae bacterium]|nr:NUDIX hydrolase [Bryobacteraceae bacterium]